MVAELNHSITDGTLTRLESSSHFAPCSVDSRTAVMIPTCSLSFCFKAPQ